MVKDGFAQKNAPLRETKKQKQPRPAFERDNPDDETQWNWSWKHSCAELKRIAKIQGIGIYAEKMNMKSVVHVTKMDNDAPQKTTNSANRRGQPRHLARLSKAAGIDATQLRKTMFKKTLQ